LASTTSVLHADAQRRTSTCGAAPQRAAYLYDCSMLHQKYRSNQTLICVFGRDRPKFGFGAKTDLKCSFGSVSVAVTTPHFTFGFSRNYTADDQKWPKLE